MDTHEDGADLIENLEVLWRQRRLILIPAFLLALITGIAGLLLPPKWEVDAVIQPGKFLIQTPGGDLREVMVTDPKQLASQINQGFYTRLISSELKLDPKAFPALKAKNPRDTRLVCVSLRTGDTEQGRKILNTLFRHLKGELDWRAEVEMKSLATRVALKESAINAKGLDIQSATIDIEKSRQAILAAENNLRISEERSRGLAEEMKNARARNEEIERQHANARAGRKDDRDALELLIFSNEIQQNFHYFNTLEEMLGDEKSRQEELRLTVGREEQTIKGFQTQIDKIKQEILAGQNDIALLNELRQRIDDTKFMKEPTVSPHPVSPKKARDIAIAGCIGLLCFSGVALLLDSSRARRSRADAGS